MPLWAARTSGSMTPSPTGSSGALALTERRQLAMSAGTSWHLRTDGSLHCTAPTGALCSGCNPGHLTLSLARAHCRWPSFPVLVYFKVG